MPGTQRGTVRNMVMTIYSVPPEWEAIKSKIKYFAYAQETCPETGNIHLQGFAQAWDKMRLAQWRDLFPNIHMEPMMGTFRENRAYCSKEGQLVEFGEKPNENGIKTTIINFKRKIDAGEQVLDIADSEDYFPTFLQYRNGFKEYASYKRHKRLRKDRTEPEVYVRIGPPGTGKTRWMDEQFGLDGWNFAPDNTGKWFDGCDCDVVLFDDVSVDAIPPLDTFKKLLDRYGSKQPTKGGYLWWHPKVIVLTSNSHPKDWWPNATAFDFGAIERRIKEIVVVE